MSDVTTPPAAPMQLLLHNTMGSLFIGVVVSAALWGVSCAQTWSYYNHYVADSKWLKITVGVVWVSDTVHQILICHAAYIYLVTNFANPLHLSRIVWSMVVEVLFNAITAVAVQTFFAVRIYRLSEKNLWATGIVGALIAANFIVMLMYTIRGLSIETYEELAEKVKALSITVNILTAASDIAIAAALVTMLHNRKTSFERSNNVLNRLIKFTVNTGLLTSICAIFSLIFYQVYANTFIYICFFFAIGRLYSNSLLANLNARESIREQATGTKSFSLPEFGNTGRTAGGLNLMRQGQHASIAVQIETTRDYDGTVSETAQDNEHKTRDLEMGSHAQ